MKEAVSESVKILFTARYVELAQDSKDLNFHTVLNTFALENYFQTCT